MFPRRHNWASPSFFGGWFIVRKSSWRFGFSRCYCINLSLKWLNSNCATQLDWIIDLSMRRKVMNTVLLFFETFSHPACLHIYVSLVLFVEELMAGCVCDVCSGMTAPLLPWHRLVNVDKLGLVPGGHQSREWGVGCYLANTVVYWLTSYED